MIWWCAIARVEAMNKKNRTWVVAGERKKLKGYLAVKIERYGVLTSG